MFLFVFFFRKNRICRSVLVTTSGSGTSHYDAIETGWNIDDQKRPWQSNDIKIEEEENKQQ